MKKMMKKLKNERGLTLVELLAVIVILAIVAVIAFVMIGKVIDNSKKDAHIANAQQLIASAKLYESSGGTVDSGGITHTELETQGVLDKLTNPWTKDTTDYQGTVYKNDNEYTVTITTNSTDCSISDDKEEDINKGRSVVCP